MNPNHDFGMRVADWLRDEAEPVHAGYLGEVLAASRVTRQRPAWSSPERWLPVDLTFPRRRLPVLPSLRLLVAVGLVAMLAALAILAAGSQPRRLPAPFGPAANGSILSEGGDGDIYVSAANGSDTRPIIAGPTFDVGPWYTHDGTGFVFLRRDAAAHTVMMANADGTNVRPLVDTPLRAVDWFEFSPDDRRLAIVHEVALRRAVSVLDLETRALRTLSVPDLDVDNNVLWLPPTGEELIFSARPHATIADGVGLYGIRPDGSDFRSILPVQPEAWPFLNLGISHDGKQLTHWLYEADASADRWGAHVHILDLASGVDRRVVFDTANEDESELRFSPDGTTGVIVAADASGAYVQLVDLVGTNPPRRVGPSFRGDEAKALGFSPDGKQVILAFDNDRPMLIDVATGEMTAGPTTWKVFSTWQRLAP
jgi:hypothetical protein